MHVLCVCLRTCVCAMCAFMPVRELATVPTGSKKARKTGMHGDC